MGNANEIQDVGDLRFLFLADQRSSNIERRYRFVECPIPQPQIARKDVQKFTAPKRRSKPRRINGKDPFRFVLSW